MSGRSGGRHGGKGGRGNGKRNDSAGGRGGHGGASKFRQTKVGLNKELEANIFDLGERSSADLLRTTQIKIAQYIGSQYGGDIMGELETKKEFVAPSPQYPASAILRQPDYENLIRKQQRNNLAKLERRKERLQNTIDASTSDSDRADLEDDMVDLDNDIAQVEYDISVEVRVPLTEEERGEWKTNEKAYGERVHKHMLNQQKAFAIILGQCTQRLQDKMHDDDKWDDVNRKQKPLQLYALIERVVMKQTGDDYPPCNVVDNILSVLLMKQQQNMSNAQWYERFCTRVDVAESMGVEFDSSKCLWDYCIQQRGWNEYDTLSHDDQTTIRSESKERLLAYLMIKNSSSSTNHDTIRSNLLESYIAKRDEYPVDRSEAVAMLNKYDEKKPNVQATSEGTAFTQKGKNKGNDKKNDMTDKKRPIFRRAAIHRRRIISPTSLASCVVRKATVLRHALIEPRNMMMTTHLFRVNQAPQ